MMGVYGVVLIVCEYYEIGEVMEMFVLEKLCEFSVEIL